VPPMPPRDLQRRCVPNGAGVCFSANPRSKLAAATPFAQLTLAHLMLLCTRQSPQVEQRQSVCHGEGTQFVSAWHMQSCTVSTLLCSTAQPRRSLVSSLHCSGLHQTSPAGAVSRNFCQCKVLLDNTACLLLVNCSCLCAFDLSYCCVLCCAALLCWLVHAGWLRHKREHGGWLLYLRCFLLLAGAGLRLRRQPIRRKC
jgi:hypothetical protein